MVRTAANSDEESALHQAPPPPPRQRATYYTPSSSFITRVLGTRKAPQLRVSESLDYEPLQNRLFQHQLRERKDRGKKLYGYTGHTLAKFVVTFATGIATGILASGLTFLVNWLHAWKQDIVQRTLDGAASGDLPGPGVLGVLQEVVDIRGGVISAVIKFWLFGGVLVTVATALVQYWAPAASGAGVTLVMAYLNGNHIPHLLRPSTLVAKFLGTVASVSSGLPMGPEGPMVHIGACVASVISYVDCRLVRSGKLPSIFGQFRFARGRSAEEKLKVLDDIVSDTDHREFISAGVSAGIAAAFGAPIGGVLYSMEEACSFWSRKVAWRCFIAGTLSTFTIQMLTKEAAHGAIAYSNLVRMETKDWMMQLPFLLVNFVMAGFLGAAFNSMRMWLWKLRAAKTMHIQRILEVLGLLVLVGFCSFFFAWAAGSCIDLPEDWWVNDQVGGKREYGVRFLCGAEQHNDLATLFLSSTHHTIVRLFSMGRVTSIDPSHGGIVSAFTPSSMALYTLVYLVLMSLGAGLAIPGGLFMPSILVGASWGGMWGILVRSWVPQSWNVQPGLYAMLAATGVLGGVFRSVISLVVLMVEGTQGIEFLPGVILAVAVANWVAHHIHHDGVYESELERTGNVYMLRDEPPHRLHTLTVQSIMATGVVGFKSIESVPKVLEVLRNTSHNGFPVFVRDDDPESGEAYSSDNEDGGGELEMGPTVALKTHTSYQQQQQLLLQQQQQAQAQNGGAPHTGPLSSLQNPSFSSYLQQQEQHSAAAGSRTDAHASAPCAIPAHTSAAAGAAQSMQGSSMNGPVNATGVVGGGYDSEGLPLAGGALDSLGASPPGGPLESINELGTSPQGAPLQSINEQNGIGEGSGSPTISAPLASRDRGTNENAGAGSVSSSNKGTNAALPAPATAAMTQPTQPITHHHSTPPPHTTPPSIPAHACPPTPAAHTTHANAPPTHAPMAVPTHTTSPAKQAHPPTSSPPQTSPYWPPPLSSSPPPPSPNLFSPPHTLPSSPPLHPHATPCPPHPSPFHTVLHPGNSAHSASALHAPTLPAGTSVQGAAVLGAPPSVLGTPPASVWGGGGRRTRLEGFILRSQLLVLLQRRHFCDSHGRPVGRTPCEKHDLELETEMRTFFRRHYTHSRYLSATPAAVDQLVLRGTNLDNASGLYVDLRPFMNRAPFTIRTDCSAARAHQVFTGIGLRHLLVVNSSGQVVGIITRKDLDHAAGHGWWRVSAVAEPPRNSFWNSMGFLRNWVSSKNAAKARQKQQAQRQQQQRQRLQQEELQQKEREQEQQRQQQQVDPEQPLLLDGDEGVHGSGANRS